MKLTFSSFLFAIVLLLTSCSPSFELNSESLMQTYEQEDRSLNLSDKGISGFINMNGLVKDTEIVNIYLSNNEIEVLNISQYTDLGRLVIDHNKIRFFGDIKYPKQVRHLDLSYNSLESLEGIENLMELKTLNVSYNKLEDEDFKILSQLPKLKLVVLEGNDVSEEFKTAMNTFNAIYLKTIKK